MVMAVMLPTAVVSELALVSLLPVTTAAAAAAAAASALLFSPPDPPPAVAAAVAAAASVGLGPYVVLGRSTMELVVVSIAIPPFDSSVVASVVVASAAAFVVYLCNFDTW